MTKKIKTSAPMPPVKGSKGGKGTKKGKAC